MPRQLFRILGAALFAPMRVVTVTAQEPRRGGVLRIVYMNPHTGLGSQAIYVEQNLLYTLATIDENAEYVAAPPEEYPPNAGLPPLGVYRMGYMISSPESYKKWDDSALRPPSCCRSPTKRQRG